MIISNTLNSNLSDVSLNLHLIAEYSALSDLPVCALFRELDVFYPGSKFIFTTRPVESWIDSAISDTQFSINKYGCMHATTRWAYGLDHIDRDVFIKRYMLHQESVSEYFSGRSDILFMDVNEENPWQKLCNFLALPTPNIYFPFLNRRG